MKRSHYFITLIFLVLVVTACSNEKAPANTEPNVIETKDDTEVKKTEEIVEEEKEFINMYPLTGIATDEVIDQRTLAVMINNDPKARPQSGLHKADLVYEVLAEGDITRFLAIFQSEMPEKFGPVRSARDYFIRLSSGYDAFYIAHGYSTEARELLYPKPGVVDNLNGELGLDGSLFTRADFRKAPHNSYVTFENVMKGAEITNVASTHTIKPLPFLSIEEIETIAGETANDIRVAYSKNKYATVEYKFDKKLGRYLRYSGGNLTEDLDTKETVYVDNILIVEASHKVIDSKLRNDIDLDSGGEGYLLQMGKMIEVNWKNVDGRILPYSNGEELGLIPGKTWINIVPSLDTVTTSTIN